jgi:hypothetical protein
MSEMDICTPTAPAASYTPATPTTSYISTILSALKQLLEPSTFDLYAARIVRIFRGTHSGASSANGFAQVLRMHPNAIHLHNELVRVTYAVPLIFNLPEVDEGSESSDGSEDVFNGHFEDLAVQFSETGGAKPMDPGDARQQVIQFVHQQLAATGRTQGDVLDLADEMDRMGFRN